MVSNLSIEKLCEFKAVFEIIDKDCKGTITVKDFKEFFYNLDQKFSEDDILEILKEAGLEGKNECNFENFLSMIVKNIKENDTEVEISELYKKFDSSCNGNLTIIDLKNILLNLGDSLSIGEIDELVNSIELNENGTICYDSFFKFMKNI